MTRFLPANLHLPAAALLLGALFVALAANASGRGTAKEAKAMVDEAIAHFDAAGPDAAFAKFTDDPAPMFKDRDLYVFVLDSKGVAIAHAADSSLLGQDLTELGDADGNLFIQKILDVSDAGGWVDYKWPNPMNGEVEKKSSWVMPHGGYYFGVGIYAM